MTPERSAVLQAVRKIGADGWPVSVREVRIATGIASTQTVHAHLVALEGDGVLRSDRRPKIGWRPEAP